MLISLHRKSDHIAVIVNTNAIQGIEPIIETEGNLVNITGSAINWRKSNAAPSEVSERPWEILALAESPDRYLYPPKEHP